jgi:hypothetical protein
LKFAACGRPLAIAADATNEMTLERAKTLGIHRSPFSQQIELSTFFGYKIVCIEPNRSGET